MQYSKTKNPMIWCYAKFQTKNWKSLMLRKFSKQKRRDLLLRILHTRLHSFFNFAQISAINSSATYKSHADFLHPKETSRGWKKPWEFTVAQNFNTKRRCYWIIVADHIFETICGTLFIAMSMTLVVIAWIGALRWQRSENMRWVYLIGTKSRGN